MELICPGCTRKLNIADQYAGQTVRCPLCSKMFQAPALSAPAPAPVPPPTPPVSALPYSTAPSPMTMPVPENVSTPPAPAAPEVFAFSDGHGDHAPTPQLVEPLPYEPQLRPLDAPYVSRDIATGPPPEPIPPGDYTKSVIWRIRPDILNWTIVGCLTAIFVLSFFPWVQIPFFGNLIEHGGSISLWGMAFSVTSPVYMLYTILTVFLALPLAWVLLAFDKSWLPRIPAFAPVWPWRHVILGGILLLALLLMTPGYLNALFTGGPLGFAQKLSLRLHLVAVICLLLQFWLERRTVRNLPLPRISLRW